MDALENPQSSSHQVITVSGHVFQTLHLISLWHTHQGKMHIMAKNCTLPCVIDTAEKITGPEATTRLEGELPSEKPVSHHIHDSKVRMSGSHKFQNSKKVVT